MFAKDFAPLGPDVTEEALNLEKNGCVFVRAKYQLSVLFGGTVLASAPFNGSTFDTFAGKAFDPSNMTMLTMANSVSMVFEKAAGALKKVIGGSVEDEEEEAMAEIKKVVLGDAASPAPVPGTMQLQAMAVRIPVHAKSLAVMPMMEAELILQPVPGTSAGSRYYLVTKGENARMAIRVKKDFDFSMRLQGLSGGHKESLKASGFFGGGAEGVDSGHYMSMHAKLFSWEDVYKLVGAIHGVLSMDEVLSPIPPLNWLMEIKE